MACCPSFHGTVSLVGAEARGRLLGRERAQTSVVAALSWAKPPPKRVRRIWRGRDGAQIRGGYQRWRAQVSQRHSETSAQGSSVSAWSRCLHQRDQKRCGATGRQKVECGLKRSWSLKGRGAGDSLNTYGSTDRPWWAHIVGYLARCTYTDCFHMASLHVSVFRGCATLLPYASCECAWLTTCARQESNALLGTSCWPPPSSCCSPGSSCEGESNAH